MRIEQKIDYNAAEIVGTSISVLRSANYPNVINGDVSLPAALFALSFPFGSFKGKLFH